jgi:branched-subunit amino acid aminotransferase/4-amino-4-deoxychorismate lyase
VAQKGHQQALWLYGNQIVEVGSSNIFFAFKDSQRSHFARSHPRLHFGTFLLIQELLRYEKEYKVSERKIYIDEVVERHKRG